MRKQVKSMIFTITVGLVGIFGWLGMRQVIPELFLSVDNAPQILTFYSRNQAEKKNVELSIADAVDDDCEVQQTVTTTYCSSVLKLRQTKKIEGNNQYVLDFQLENQKESLYYLVEIKKVDKSLLYVNKEITVSSTRGYDYKSSSVIFTFLPKNSDDTEASEVGTIEIPLSQNRKSAEKGSVIIEVTVMTPNLKKVVSEYHHEIEFYY